MAGAGLTLRRADGNTIGYVERLLADADLPTDDVRAKADCFHVAERAGAPVGVGGLEPRGTAGLLRSVVVEPAERGRGLGTALCDALEAEAREAGVETLYLLTETAAAFFGDRGFVEVDRAAAPAAIRETTEFTDLCSASATCMRKSL